MSEIRPVRDDERERVARQLADRWGSPVVVSRGIRHDLRELPTLVAEEDGDIVGIVTYAPASDEAEITSLDALRPDHGVGTALLDAVIDIALGAGWRRLWLVTTNDNTHALRFYQRRGWQLVAVHRDAIDDARRLKPEIPARGNDDIPIRHELELELLL
ncbi:MAG TPA: GNAT family N-acetyltransferase [Jatrophihabitantaceae bacterium]|jgi:GNAT superfamily N-acetyltransferase